jgi:hypothetical protein
MFPKIPGLLPPVWSFASWCGALGFSLCVLSDMKFEYLSTDLITVNDTTFQIIGVQSIPNDDDPRSWCQE